MTDGAAIPTSNSIFWAMSDTDMILWTLPDVRRRRSTLVDDGRLQKFKMADSQTGSVNKDPIATATPTVVTVPDPSVTLPTLSNIG